MRKEFFAAAVLSLSMLTSCSMAGSAENLLMPPMLSAEQADIYAALKKELGSDFKLKYPKSGDYRSAFIVENIDDEPGDEALVIYERTGGELVRINVLDKDENGGWHSVYDHAGAGTEIEGVKICRIGGSSELNILVGYNTVNLREKLLKAYVYRDGVLVNTYDDSYFTSEVMDLDGDGLNEIELISEHSDTKPASVKIVTFGGDGLLYAANSIYLDSGSSEIYSISKGYVAGGCPALFIDSVRGTQGLSTEIIYCVDGELRNPVALSDETIKATLHPKGYSPVDADGDGITEIPTVSPFPGYENVSQGGEVINITTWNVFENYSIVPKSSGFYSRSDGYCFMIPARWEGVVTVKADNLTDEYVFCRYGGSLDASGTELMRIAAVDSVNEESYLDNGYFTVKAGSGKCYMIKIIENQFEPLVPTEAEVFSSFYLI